ncbi:hypothetical protein K7X08_014193 [Anisodus acutangulus]|uniref:Uncharacterized protein n=1 Tax=Anisodus acutangulus TaxID=402998 RepID=A0A9Q1R254_9SOLA|nr:hypothetical protein K7X08_014193 [Anisodus acutangulus]
MTQQKSSIPLPSGMFGKILAVLFIGFLAYAYRAIQEAVVATGLSPELADQLELGSKFYVAGFSMGGQAVWTLLKYIPHRLAGAALLAPVTNYWWPNFPANLSDEAFSHQLTQDRWNLCVAHYLPWLTNWWNTQKFFPACSAASYNHGVLSSQDLELIPKYCARRDLYMICHRRTIKA